ncbi:MAG: hypothetical protein CL606_08270 [Anaerolineaceae bacterium]|nr:hypothetical protein [Anaerolineaceae bacterium]|tara:strand:+ start:313 stop:2640 length:2328 start_codon:yes stop_codon:yes gene_type:complete
MTLDLTSLPKIVRLQLRIRQYPILGKEIRRKMLDEIFRRGIITPEQMDNEVRQRSIESQELDGQNKSLTKEPAEIWKIRTSHVRDYLTEFYFAYNLPMYLFDNIVNTLVKNRAGNKSTVSDITYNPEMAPLDLLMDHGKQIESLNPDDQQIFSHHLAEIIVVAIKTVVSDRLEFVGTARKWFTIQDLFNILDRRIGTGKIGGKAAGIELAKIMMQGDNQLASEISTPQSYFVATDVFDQFKDTNELTWVMNQKYRSADEIRELYPTIKDRFNAGSFPNDITQELQDLLQRHKGQPIIVRSSSLLEDSYGTSFAGKYHSYFCANQANASENLDSLSKAISKIYASVYSPDALLYRKKMGLLDYDERMAILIQVVEGDIHGNWYYPPIAGVAFSQNQYRWTPRINPDDGLVRMVCGLGTRAVNQTTDYARMIALSHPNIRPESGANAIQHYSQKKIDVINLKTNSFETQSITKILHGKLKWLRLVAMQIADDYLSKLITISPNIDSKTLVLTFDQLLEQTNFVSQIKRMLQYLSRHYNAAVDIEFTTKIEYKENKPIASICLVQCRPQSLRTENSPVTIPADLHKTQIVFKSHGMVQDAQVDKIRFVVIVPISAYDSITDPTRKTQVARIIGRLNHTLREERFVLIGPHRWGSSNPDLGVKVTYADVHNTKMLIELVPDSGRKTSEPSYGTHFFQDLVEANIYPLAINLTQDEAYFDESMFSDSPNLLAKLSPKDASYADLVKIYDIQEITNGNTLSVVMVSSTEKSVGFISNTNKK